MAHHLLMRTLHLALISSAVALSFRSSHRDLIQPALFRKLSSSHSHGQNVPAALGAGSTEGNADIYRRSPGLDSTSVCGLPSDKVLTINPQMFGETAENLQASWVGKDRLLIVASDDKRTTVWQGHVVGHGVVFRIDKDDTLIGEPVYPLSMRVSPVDSNIVTVVSQSKQYLYTSTDAGHSWGRVRLPSNTFTPEADIYLSHLSSSCMVLVSTAGELYSTDNLGKSWSKIANNVKAVSFSSGPTHPSAEYLYYSIGSAQSPFNPLYRYNTATHRSEVVDLRSFKFNVDGRYLYVSRQNYTGQTADSLSRRLYVSSNYDTPDAHMIRFTEVQLPSLKPEELFVIMATHEAGTFIHVSDSAGVQYGRLYMSDSTGSRFSLSLDNHLYHVMDTPAMMHVDDFYEVKSTRGVYITTAVVPNVGHVSMITYNNGGSWQRIKAPEGSGCTLPECSLHIHIRFSQLVGPFYNIPSLALPFSTNSSNGIIIAHGSVGAVRNDSSPRLYISADGGYTWTDPGLPGGSYVYGVADYGNVMAAIPNGDVVEHIWFSHDLGSCFRREVLDSSSVFHLARGLMVDPSAASLYAFVLGVEGMGEGDMWRMVTINFGSLLNSKCQKDDYENTTDPKCLLGYRNVYNVTRRTSVCYNDEGYVATPIDTISCLCTKEDFECDYDFYYNGTACNRLDGFSLASVCAPGATSYNESSSGYRLITGDRCVPTAGAGDLIRLVEKPCTSYEQDSGYLVVHVTTRKVVVGVVIIIAIVGVATLTLFAFIKCYRTRSDMKEQVRYKRVPLTERDDDDGSEDDTTSKLV